MRPFESILVVVFLSFIIALAGCEENKVEVTENLGEFDEAGDVVVVGEEPNEVIKTFARSGPYQIMPGDVLEFNMPGVLRLTSPELADALEVVEPYLCRVNDQGIVLLPIIGEVSAIGKTVSELEQEILYMYYPKYVVVPTSVVCTVKEHLSQRSLTVLGLVNTPGVYEYPYNIEYNLIDAISLAGGVDMLSDPHYTTVYRKDASGEVVSATFKIDRICFAQSSNVILQPGDTVFVEITQRTKMNRFWSDLFYFKAGADMRF